MDLKKLRTQLLINPKFQLQFAMNCLIPMLMMAAVFWLILEMFISKMVRIGQAQGLPGNHEYFQLIQAQRIELLQILLLFSLVLVILFFVWGLFYSHRIAGPIFKLTKWLDESQSLQEAVDQPVQFRKKDLFQEIPLALNSFLKKLK